MSSPTIRTSGFCPSDMKANDVLKKLYYKNALRIFPGLSSEGFPQ